MKQILCSLLLMGLLLTAAGCGESMDGDEKARTDNPRIGDVETPAERSASDDDADRSGDGLRRAVRDAADDVEETLDGSTWDEMLRNGRVRDTDGDLTDGENALHGRYGVRS